MRRGRHWEPEPSRSGRRLRLFTATGECARGGGGGGGGGRAPGEGAGAGRRRGAGAGTGLSWGPASPPPPPSPRSPGERAANPRRPLRARPGPGRGAPVSGGAFPFSPSSFLSLSLSLLHGEFLNFDELTQRTFLKGPRTPRRPSPPEVGLGAEHPALPRPSSSPPRRPHARGRPKRDSWVVGFRKESPLCTLIWGYRVSGAISPPNPAIQSPSTLCFLPPSVGLLGARFWG